MTDLTRPVAGDPLSSSNGKASTVILDEAFDLIETNEDAIAARTSSSIVTPDSFSEAALAVINNCDATTGWATTNGGVSIDTAIKTEGTGSLKANLPNNTGNGIFGKVYYNLAAPLTVTGRAVVMLDARWFHSGVNNSASLFEAVIASGTALSGTVSVVSLAGITESAWSMGIAIPTTGLTTISSVGIRAKALVTANAGNGAFWWIDNVRLPAQSKLESAMQSAPTIAVVVPPTYPAEPLAQIEGTTKTILDLRPSSAVLGRHGGVRHVREWAVPDDGSVEVSAQLRDRGGLNNGDTLQLSPTGRYLCNQPWHITSKYDITIDGQGASIFTNIQRGSYEVGEDDSHISAAGCRGLTIRNLRLVGYRKDTFNGSALTNVTGTPTASGTTKLLDTQNQEVRVPKNNASPSMTSYYARDVDGNLVVEATLSDTAHVAGDCMIQMVDDLVPTTVIASSTLTLTSTPTVYRLAVRGDKWVHTRPRMTVKKVTATANTITVTNMMPYGRIQYVQFNSEDQQGILVNSCEDTLIEDCQIEGIQADGVTCDKITTIGLIVRRVVSRGCSRQGMSFNAGRYILVEDCEISESFRSGIDFEPYGASMILQDITIRNCRIFNSENFSLACTNWAKIHRLHVDGLESNGVGAGFMRGGCQNGTFRNIIHRNTADGDADFELRGLNCRVENVTTFRGFKCSGDTQVVDTVGWEGTFTTGGNVVRNVTVTTPTPERPLMLTSPNSSFENISLLNTDTGAVASLNAPLYVGSDPELTYSAVNLGIYKERFPGTYKGDAYAPGSIWMPGGFDHLNDPLLNVRAISAGAVQGNNLRGIGLAVTAGSTTTTVTFPTRTLPSWSGWNAPVGATSGAGTLALGTYYVRFATKDIYGGPGAWQAQSTVVLTGTQNAINFDFNEWARDAIGVISGWTLLRGTVNGGPYTTRYDVGPFLPFYALDNNNQVFTDRGSVLFSTMDEAALGYVDTYNAQTGSWTAVNESGYEPDTAYGVFIVPSWPTTVSISAKRTNGFDVQFGVACPTGGGTFDWFLVR